MPLLSIIVPIYNVELFLEDCINSVINQTFKDFELILVDDGSTDNSSKICDDFKEKDERIVAIHKENRGLSSARNAGIDIARGEWIAFVDSDDTIAPDMYEKMINAAILNEVKMVICSAKYMSEDGKEYRDIPRPDSINFGEVEITSSHAMIDNLRWRGEYDNNLFVIACNKLYNKNLFSKLRFVEGVIHEDEMLANSIYIDMFKIAIIHEPLYNYRQRQGSITHEKIQEKNMIVLEILKNRVEIFFENKFSVAAYYTAKTFIEIYIELYFKANDVGHPEWVSKYTDLWGMVDMAVKAEPSLLSKLKFIIRVAVFLFFPDFYEKLFIRR